MALEPEILRYYEKGLEHDRLTARNSLELIRTQVLLERFLPPAPARVLDVGGGSGVYATWLIGLGYDVTLIDPVPLHVELARSAGVESRIGDARRLDEADDSYEATLLLGPLYHLPERGDRIQALTEARRVTRPGGVVVAAAISRYASMLDGFYRAFVDRPGFTETMLDTLATGRHSNPTDDPGRFTSAYFHHPAELGAELADAGLTLQAILPVEGPLLSAPGLAERLADPTGRALVLDVLARIESDPALLAATAHLLAIGTPVS